jgi:hypothetical protein
VWKVGEYQKIFYEALAAIFMPSEDLANTFGLKLLQCSNYFEIIAIIANLKDHKRTQ